MLYLQDKGCEDTKPIIAALKSKGVTAIGAAVFCWGGESSQLAKKSLRSLYLGKKSLKGALTQITQNN